MKDSLHHYCGLLGHDRCHCANRFNLTKSGAEVEYQYGDWLKAMGGCSQSSVKHYVEQAHKPSSAKENGSDNVHELRQQGQSGDSTAKDVPNGNLRESERRAHGES